MSKIKITESEATKIIEAGAVGEELIFSNYRTRKLKLPVKVDGKELPTEATIRFDGDAVADFGNGDAVSGEITLAVYDEFAELRYHTQEAAIPALRAAANAGEDSLGLGAISGGIGPFVYTLDMNLDQEDYTRSYFAVSLSLFGIKLCDAHLDVNNPRLTFGATVCGVGAKGTLGVDFDGGRIYMEANLEYLVGTKHYSYDLYNWKNYRVQFAPSAEGGMSLRAGNFASDASVGVISISNSGGYVAKFTLSYSLDGKRYSKESDNFTSGITKSMEIPAGATNVVVTALAAWFIASWNEIFSKKFDGPVVKKYRVSGTTLNTSYEEISI